MTNKFHDEQALIPQVTGYQLPEPAYRRLPDLQSGIDNWYSAEQMQQAYQEGREWMREECLDLCYGYVRNATDLRDAIKEIQMNEYQLTAANIPTSTSIGASGREVIRIQPGGSIFWCGREVVGDEMFKAAMIDLLAVLRGFK